MARQTLLLEFSYLGGYFYGVQPQPGRRTVGSELHEQLAAVLGNAPRGLTFAARTDSGVNAVQNFATCWHSGTPLTDAQLQALSEPRHSALQVRRVEVVPRSMNARANAQGKHYQYRILTQVAPPLGGREPNDGQWWIARPLCINRMQAAARCLIGTHDFSAFRAAGCQSKSPVKSVYNLSIRSCAEQVVIDIEGTAFVRKMVRLLVGTLAEVGVGLRSVDSVESLLASRQRRRAALVAPARGLWLMSVSLRWQGMRHAGMPIVRHTPPKIELEQDRVAILHRSDMGEITPDSAPNPWYS